MTGHEAWTDRLSDYLDDELAQDERAEVEAHLGACAECSRTLTELRRVVAAAATLSPMPPRADLWSGIAERIEPGTFGRFGNGQRRVTFTLPQLAAASLLLAAISGGAVALMLGHRSADGTPQPESAGNTAPQAGTGNALPAGSSSLALQSGADVPVVAAVEYADAQYDAAVADLDRALQSGRGRLDPTTISVVEENLAIIDRAIAEARSALDSDPSNGYLSGHLMEARRRKLDLLRKAAELTEAN